MNPLEQIHDHYVLGRRAWILAGRLADKLPLRARVLDVGCGDGRLAGALMRVRPDLEVQGVDVLVRSGTPVPVLPFDGRALPFPARSFDAVLVMDVLHHAEDPAALLREAARVSGQLILIKDHTCDRFGSVPILRFMDWVGNARHGVPLRYKYWKSRQWQETLAALGLRVESWESDLGLYPPPASWLFGGSLQFLAQIASPGRASA
jgi:SAM-dependent methyltransferase